MMGLVRFGSRYGWSLPSRVQLVDAILTHQVMNIGWHFSAILQLQSLSHRAMVREAAILWALFDFIL